MKPTVSFDAYVVAISFIFTMKCSYSKGVSAVRKQVAFIPCTAFSEAKGVDSQVTLIRWLRSSFYKPLYTLDLRSLDSSLNGDLSFLYQGRHFPSPETEGRLYIDLAHDPIALRIDPVTEEDAGTYTCQIDFRNRRSVKSSVALDVIIPPKEAAIRDSTGQKLEGVIGPYLLGETMTFSCESVEGYPPPTTKWETNHDSEKIVIRGSLLVINFLERRDQWAHFTCLAQNNNMTAPKSVTVIIELFLPPQELALHSNMPQPFVAGQSVLVTCLSFGSYPKGHIIWEKDNERITAEERILDNGNLTTGFIEFVVQPSDDKSLLECSAVNPDIPTSVLRKRLYMIVYYPPEVNIVIVSNKTQIAEKQNLVLLCNYTSNPDVDAFLWLFNGKEFVDYVTVIAINNKLFIKNLNISNSGKYSCRARNKFGENEADIDIKIRHKPVCQKSEISYSYGQEMDDVNVTCNLHSYPSDVTFYWSLLNSSSNHSWSTDRVSHTRVELQKSNFELLCWGRNEIGVQITPCRLQLAKMSESNFLFLPVLIISISVAVLIFVSIYFVVRKYKLNYELNSNSSSSENEMVQLKDNSCGKLISKCVKQPGTKTETDCSSKLLHPIAKYLDSCTRQPQLD